MSSYKYHIEPCDVLTMVGKVTYREIPWPVFVILTEDLFALNFRSLHQHLGAGYLSHSLHQGLHQELSAIPSWDTSDPSLRLR